MRYPMIRTAAILLSAITLVACSSTKKREPASLAKV